MLLMRANPLRGQVGGGWALEIETFLGPVIWHRAVRLVSKIPTNLFILEETWTIENVGFFYANQISFVTRLL
jgi:hypothetical protein